MMNEQDRRNLIEGLGGAGCRDVPSPGVVIGLELTVPATTRCWLIRASRLFAKG